MDGRQIMLLFRCSMLDEKKKKNPVRKVDVKKCENQLLLYCSECVGVGSTLEIQVHTLKSRQWDCVHPGFRLLKGSSWGFKCVITRAPYYWEWIIIAAAIYKARFNMPHLVVKCFCSIISWFWTTALRARYYCWTHFTLRWLWVKRG